MQRGSVEQRKSMGMAKRYGPVMTALRQGGDGGGRLTLQPGGMGGGGTRGFTPRKGGFASGGGGGTHGLRPGRADLLPAAPAKRTNSARPGATCSGRRGGGAELPRHIAQEAEEQARVERAVEAARERAAEQARVDTVSGAAPAVKREDAWKWRSAAERAEYEGDGAGRAGLRRDVRGGRSGSAGRRRTRSCGCWASWALGPGPMGPGGPGPPGGEDPERPGLQTPAQRRQQRVRHGEPGLSGAGAACGHHVLRGAREYEKIGAYLGPWTGT